jgi:hypothetical protein
VTVNALGVTLTAQKQTATMKLSRIETSDLVCFIFTTTITPFLLEEGTKVKGLILLNRPPHLSIWRAGSSSLQV